MSQTRERVRAWADPVRVEPFGAVPAPAIETNGHRRERAPARDEPAANGPLGGAAIAVMLAFIFTIPLESFAIVPGLGTMSKVTGAAALFMALVAAVTGTKLRRPMTFHLLLLLFVAWNALSYYWSANHAMTTTKVTTYF